MTTSAFVPGVFRWRELLAALMAIFSFVNFVDAN